MMLLKETHTRDTVGNNIILTQSYMFVFNDCRYFAQQMMHFK